jgi:hypothetical protein
MNEPYTITPSENGREVLLCIRQDQEMRAWNVARALRGRWAPGLRAFHMTPARAEKWKILYAAGFDAHTIRSHDQRVWVFTQKGVTFTLGESMRLAETQEPEPIPEIEVEF